MLLCYWLRASRRFAPKSIFLAPRLAQLQATSSLCGALAEARANAATGSAEAPLGRASDKKKR